MASSAGTQRTRAPATDEIEISIFGPGYGESVLVHFGFNEWLIVDSCLDKRTSSPSPTSYLRSIGVDPTTSVKLLVASHWHDDHVGGIASILDDCQGAKFFCSAALQSKEFITLVRAVGSRSNDRGVQEFAKIMTLLVDRARNKNESPNLASENQRLWQRLGSNLPAEIWALSPSSVSITAALRNIAQLIPTSNQPKRRLMALTPNHAAVVLWVSIGAHSILLGSDLEETTGSTRNWSAIVGSTAKPTGLAKVFKIPHHGSSNGHCAEVWSGMLDQEPFVALTPFVRGNVSLPTRTDVSRIYSLTPNAFATAQLTRNPQVRRHGALNRAIRQATRRIRLLPTTPGHVRFRRIISNAAPWSVELFDGAVRLDEAIL